MCGTVANELVLHNLRVIDESSGTPDIKRHVLYSGVCANSWLSPIGITTTTKKKAPSQTHASSPLPVECRQTLRRRAQSANALLGRRHFEIARQEIGEDEILNGTRMKTRSDDGWERDSVGRWKVGARPKTAGTVADRPENSKRRDHVRPHTSIGEYGPRSRPPIGNPPSSQTAARETELPSFMTITPMTSNGQTKERQDGPRGPETDSARTPRCTSSNSPEPQTTGFRSVAAMLEAYDVRVKSAHASTPRTNSGTPGAAQAQTKRSSSENEDCGRPKGHSTPRNRFQREHKSPGPRAYVRCNTPRLKPLMYNHDDDELHHTGCPSGCRGCFRACLAPEEFSSVIDKQVQGQRESKQTPNKVNGFHPKSHPRVRVVRKEMPEDF